MHKALARQLKRTLRIDNAEALAEVESAFARLAKDGCGSAATAQALAGFRDFLARVDQTYEQADRDLDLRTRSLELSSDELTRANDSLRRDLASRARAQEALRAGADQLLLALGRAPVGDVDDDLETLSGLIFDLIRQREEGQQAMQGLLTDLDNQKFALDQHSIVSITDTAGIIHYANDRFCAISGYEREELIGQPHRIVNSGLHPRAFFRDMWATITAGRVWRGEIRNRAKDGSFYWVDASIVPFLDAGGRPRRYIAIRTDISQRKVMEQYLVESEQHYRGVVDNLREVIFRTDTDGRWVFLNPAWARVTGFPVAETLARHAWDFVAPALRDAYLAEFHALLAGSKDHAHHELRFHGADGRARWFEVYARADRDVDGRVIGVAGTLNDVTERRLAADQLKEQLHLVRELIEAMPLPVYVKDEQLRYVQLNRAFEEFFAIRREDFLGRNVYDLLPHDSADGHDTLDRQLLAAKGGHAYEAEVVNRLGRRHTAIYRKAALSRPDGSVRGLLGVITDITDRKEVERELMQAKDKALAANQAKSTFLANMSHEIRTPMNGILGMTALALDTPLSGAQREYLTVVQSSAESLLTIIDDILDFSKIEAGRLDIEQIGFDLRRGLTDALAPLTLRAVQKGIHLECHVDADLPQALVGDPGRLRQVIVNLVSNAIKFTERGTVKVGIARVERRSADVGVRVTVADTGIGIAGAKLAHIFEPFTQEDASTTRRFGGTGLGLTISARLVALMGGRLWVDSAPGEGSVFTFELGLSEPVAPLAGTAGSLVPPPAAVAATPKAALRILLAEDHPVNQLLAVKLFSKWGHQVTVVNNGREAVDVATAAQPSAEPFDLIFMDVQMPEMDGLTAARLVRSRETAARRVPIIAITANAMRGDRESCLAAGMDDYVAKPFQAEELRRVLQRHAPQPPAP